MIRKTFIFYFFIIAGTVQQSYAQNSKIDSLLAILKTDKEDTMKVIHLLLVYQANRSLGEFDKSLAYGKQALALSQSLSYEKGITDTYNKIGVIYTKKGNYPEALKNFYSCLKIKEKTKDKLGIANMYNNIGEINRLQGNYSEALKSFRFSLKLYEEVNDKKLIAISHNNIGIIYKNQGNYAEALKNHMASLKLRQEINDKPGISSSSNNIGNIYNLQGNYPEALKNYIASLEIDEEAGDKEAVATSFINIASVYTKLNKFKESQEYLKNALMLSKEIGSNDAMKDCYAGLTILDSITGNYKAAFSHHKLYILYRDSLNNEETKKQSLQTSMQYEFDKKEIATKADQEKKDVIVAQEKQKQKIVISLVSLVLCLVVLFSVFLYNRFRITNKQKFVIEEQKLLVDKAYESLHTKNKEVLDSINYAQRIQHSFLATNEVLDENLKEYFIFFQPKDVVSGDFYWAETLTNGNFILATADSTGHGVPGAIMSLLNITSLERAAEHFTNPADILNHTRQTIIKRLKRDGSAEGGKDGMDCSLIVFDFANKQLQIAAANNPIWIIRNNELIEIKPDKMPVGKSDRDKESFTLHTIELLAGDTIYTLTDGFPDQFGGANGKKFMRKKLKELLLENVNLPILQQKELLVTTFKNWLGDLDQVDDVCVIGIKI